MNASSAAIVTANYAARRSPNRWLIRPVGQNAGVPHRAVVASKVTFGLAFQFERDQGCTHVAHCETAVGNRQDAALPEGTIRLKFDSFEGFLGPDGKPIEACAELYLQSDGSMHALVASDAPSLEPATEDREPVPA
jgi:hypothetical protein